MDLCQSQAQNKSEIMEKLGLKRSPIDIHSHFNSGSPFDVEDGPIGYRSLAFLESVYEKSGVSEVGVSTFPSVFEHPECVCEENEFLHRLIDEKTWVYQWVVIDPRQKETYAQAERMLSHPKVLGIKIHPGSHGYDILDHSDQLFSFANARKAVVLMHPQHKTRMASLMDHYADMKLIVAHLGSQKHIDAIANAKHGNIYTDTSGSSSSLNHVIEHAVECVGSEKILFGTDSYAFSFQFGRIALSDLPLPDKENILWKNAMSLFPAAFQS